MASYHTRRYKAKYQLVGEFIAHVTGWSTEIEVWMFKNQWSPEVDNEKWKEKKRDIVVGFFTRLPENEWELLADYLWIIANRSGDPAYQQRTREGMVALVELRAFTYE